MIRDVNTRVSVNDERRNSNGRNSSRTGITTSVLSRQGETPAAACPRLRGAGVAGGDHLGAGMVPEPGAERREAFAGEYGDEHEGKDTRDHFGSGMDVHASFEGAAAAREMASARAAARRRRARRDAEARAQAAAAGAPPRRRRRRRAPPRRRSARVWRLPPPSGSWKRRAWRARRPRRLGSARWTPARRARGGWGVCGRRRPAARRARDDREAPTLYSAAEASRKGREGSGWFDALGETAPARARARTSGAAPPPPWLLGAETESPSSGGDRITGRGGAGGARCAPFATADSFATWSSHVASAEARLMALSQERDQLEGELSRMPEGSGRTLEQRRKKANAEKRLEEVLKASSAARHQLKAANRNLGHAA